MKLLVAVGMLVGLSCGSALASPPASEYQSFSGVRVDSDPVLMAKFDKAVRSCEPRVAQWDRGNWPVENKYIYIAALRNCLYRQSFISRGAYAYPVNAPFEHLIDR